MKTKNKKIGALIALSAALLIPAVLIASCIDLPTELAALSGAEAAANGYETPVIGQEGNYAPRGGGGYEVEPSAGVLDTSKPRGLIQLSVNVAGSEARTIIPNTSAITNISYFDKFDILCKAVTGVTPLGTDKDFANEDYSFFSAALALDEGDYTITVIAKKSDGGTPTPSYFAMAAGSETGVQVRTASATSKNITVKEIVDGEGPGTFTYNFSNTSTYDTASMTITSIGGSALPAIDLKTDTSDSIELDSGFYRVEITLEQAKRATVKIPDFLYIYEGFTVAYPGAVLPTLRVNAYDVIYVRNDGAPAPAPAQTVETTAAHGTAFAKPSAPTHRVDPLIDFDDFYSDSSLTTLAFPSGNPIVAASVIKDITLYLKWLIYGATITPNVTYTPGVSPNVTVDNATYTVTGITPSPSSITFTVSNNTLFNSYKWLFDGVEITGQTNNSLTIDLTSDPKYSQIGDYTVTVEAKRISDTQDVNSKASWTVSRAP